MSIYIRDNTPCRPPPQNPVLRSRKGKIWKNPTKRAQQNGTFQVSAVLVEMARKGPKTYS